MLSERVSVVSKGAMALKGFEVQEKCRNQALFTPMSCAERLWHV